MRREDQIPTETISMKCLAAMWPPVSTAPPSTSPVAPGSAVRSRRGLRTHLASGSKRPTRGSWWTASGGRLGTAGCRFAGATGSPRGCTVSATAGRSGNAAIGRIRPGSCPELRTGLSHKRHETYRLAVDGRSGLRETELCGMSETELNRSAGPACSNVTGVCLISQTLRGPS